MKYNLLVRGVFSAAHRLMGSGGKCENMHGHNFRVELTVGGNDLGDTGMLIDFSDLTETLARILEDLDHSDLNTLEPFRDKSPSSESIAEYIFGRAELDLAGSGAEVLSVTVAESDTASATYISQKADSA
ncbi:MAG: 6-pyruvoyl tetrahydropterin synthase family protein [bacterium]